VQLKERLKQDFQVFKRLTINTLQQFSCIQMDREPLPEYLRRFVQKKAQTLNFSEKDAIEKFIEGLLPSQLASHLDREPPKSLSELYAEVEKYAKSEADHKRRVEQRKLMRQQQNWQQSNQANPNQHQYILLVEPSQDTDQQEEFDPYIIPPPAQPSKEQDNNNSKELNQRSRTNRGVEKGEAEAADLRKVRKNYTAISMGPQKLYCHRTN